MVRSQQIRGGYLPERSVASVANHRSSSHDGLRHIGCVGNQPVSVHPQGILFAAIEETDRSVANSSLSFQSDIVIISKTRMLRQYVYVVNQKI